MKYTKNESLYFIPTSGHRLASGVKASLANKLRHWVPRLVALLIALELGLLSPLSCVIHCLVQQLLAERPAIAFFLCGEHARAAQDVTVIPTGQAEAPATTMTPRALYELVSIIAPLLLLSSLLVTLLFLPPARRFAPLTIPPPTPPPRLLHA